MKVKDKKERNSNIGTRKNESKGVRKKESKQARKKVNKMQCIVIKKDLDCGTNVGNVCIGT